MSMHKRSSRSQRKMRFETKKMHIFSEGPTERKYVEKENIRLRGSGWSIKAHKECNGPTPKLVDDTLDYIRKNGHEFEPGDEIYILFDYDVNLENSQNAEARLANSLRKIEEYNKDPHKGIRIIPLVSNDAFELWLVLHFQDINGHTLRTNLNALLSKHLSHEYEKASSTLYDELEKLGDRDAAIKRAKKLETENHRSNPSTEIYKLVETIALRTRDC